MADDKINLILILINFFYTAKVKMPVFRGYMAY